MIGADQSSVLCDSEFKISGLGVIPAFSPAFKRHVKFKYLSQSPLPTECDLVLSDTGLLTLKSDKKVFGEFTKVTELPKA